MPGRKLECSLFGMFQFGLEAVHPAGTSFEHCSTNTQRKLNVSLTACANVPNPRMLGRCNCRFRAKAYIELSDGTTDIR